MAEGYAMNTLPTGAKGSMSLLLRKADSVLGGSSREARADIDAYRKALHRNIYKY